MHFLFSLLRIKDLYMFQALLAHPQEVLHKRCLIYCVRVISIGCTRIEVEIQSWCSQRGALLFNLLRIKGLYIFQALLANPQEVLHKRCLIYCVRVMSIGCTRIEVELQSKWNFNPGAANVMHFYSIY
jgi:uncharacterized protein YrrD